jgi:GTP cyclohydrolase II
MLMNDSFLRNREGKIIARVDGATLRDGTGKIVAIYHATEDVTRDRTGRIVGKGNQMLRALGQRERRE